MAKFKVRLKITGFELDVEGTRDDIPLIGQNIARQIAGVIEPASAIVEGEALALPDSHYSNGGPGTETPEEPRRRRSVARRATVSRDDENSALDWVHNPDVWGTPRQEWSSIEKTIWLLYVADKNGVAKEMTRKQILATFGKHFREAKPINRTNINRDLGKAKGDGFVAENTTKEPSTWYLIEKGIKEAEKLVAKGRGAEAIA